MKRRSEIQINDSADVCRIEIEGTIGLPEECQFDDPARRVATYDRFREALRRIAAIDRAEIVVEIRSTGGDVNDALLIHDALRQTGARITTRCYGYTASAATIIAQAATEGCRELSASSLYLIHNAVCAAEGNAAEIASRVELLRQTDRRIAALYAARSGRGEEAFAALMGENNGNGRWLSPAEAVGAGLADRILDDAPSPLVRNVARGWQRLLEAVGVPPKPLPAGGGLLRLPEAELRLRRRSLAAREEALRRVEPTRTLPCEDPPFGEPARTANRLAYDEDAKRMKNF